MKTDELTAAIKGLSDEDRAAIVAALQSGDEAPAAATEAQAEAEPQVTTTEAEVEKNDVPAAEAAQAEPATPEVADEPAAQAEESQVAAEPVAKSDETVVSKADFEALRKAFEESQATIAKQQETMEVRDAVEEVRKAFPELGADAKGLAEAKYRMTKGATTDEDVKFVFDLVSKLYKAVQESKLFEEFGSSEEGDVSPEAAIDREAAALMAADPTLSKSQAIAKAVTMGAGRKAYAEITSR